jgi:cytoskeletal protein CcmA (bactofilin family)
MFGRKKAVTDEDLESEDNALLNMPEAESLPEAPLANGADAPISFRPEIPRRQSGEFSAAGRPAVRPEASGQSKTLHVGRDIVLSGQIAACDRLIVEGRVEATLTDCKIIEIGESGSFKGSVEIEDAEIRGQFDGKLQVRGRLMIRKTGRVNGEIRYGQIEIECGGTLTGVVETGGVKK